MSHIFAKVTQTTCGVAAFVFCLGFFYSAWRMIRGRREGVRAFGREVMWNPFNIGFLPSLLTDQGLRARKWFFVCLCGFPLSLLASFVASQLLSGQ